ncbi:hypothetical protein OSTOST_02576 [Ostertagia ostertagi]
MVESNDLALLSRFISPAVWNNWHRIKLGSLALIKIFSRIPRGSGAQKEYPPICTGLRASQMLGTHDSRHLPGYMTINKVMSLATNSTQFNACFFLVRLGLLNIHTMFLH